MTPSDTFESFDMNNFDDFLARESLDEERNESSHSAASSFSESFDMMPVYRSIEVMSDVMPLEGVDQVWEPPVLSRGREGGGKRERGSLGLSLGEPVEDLFATLESDFSHSSLPCQFEQLGGIATTSVDIVSCLSSLSATIMTFLKSRGVHFEHCDLSSLWRCELTDFVDSCKFNIQVYSKKDDTEYTVEFLRLSGSSLLFSTEFQKFKCTNGCLKVETEKSSIDMNDMSSLAPVEMPLLQQSLESFVNWASADQAEATRAVCGLFSSNEECSESESPLVCLTKCCGDQMSSEAIMVMTLLGTMCTKYKQQYEQNKSSSSHLPLLSLLKLLLQTKRDVDSSNIPLNAVLSQFIDSLIPATANLTTSSTNYFSNSQTSSCERSSAFKLMEMQAAL